MTEDKIVISAEYKGKRLDVFLSEKLGITRSQVQKMIKRGEVLINSGAPKKSGEKLTVGDVVEVLASKLVSQYQGNVEDINIEVIADESDYLVVNKPADLLTHPTEAKEPVSLVAWLLEKYPEIEGVGESPNRPGIVHRLDKDASGLLVVAKNQKMFVHLKKQFQERSVEKEYLVLVHGIVESDHDTIDFEIDRGKDGRMAARPKIDKLKLKNVNKIQEGKQSATEFLVEERLARYTLLRVKIHTGRTHQIRVHMLAYNHPVVGDRLYFNKNLFKKSDKQLDRLFLHAAKLCFVDLDNNKKCFEAGLPGELGEYLNNLRN